MNYRLPTARTHIINADRSHVCDDPQSTTRCVIQPEIAELIAQKVGYLPVNMQPCIDAPRYAIEGDRERNCSHACESHLVLALALLADYSPLLVYVLP